MKIGYVLTETDKKPCGINRFIIECLKEMKKMPQLDIGILGYDYFNYDKCTYFPALYYEGNLKNRYKEITVLAEAVRFDIIHSFYYPLPKIKNIKTIITIHDLIPLINTEWFPDGEKIREYYDCGLRYGANTADCVLAVSEHTKSDIIKYYNIEPNKIKVVYPGLYVTEHAEKQIKDDEILQKYGINRNYILSICTIEPRKNLISLIKAYELLRDKRPDYDMDLVLVGRNGWVNTDIYSVSAQSKYSSDIIFTGYVENYELDILYKNALLFAYISYYEGFGLPILEAMAKGTVVLSSDTSSMPEVGGEAVCYCNPYDMESIVNQLDNLLYDEKLRIEMKARALIQADKFSYKKLVNETIEIYNELLNI